MSPIFDHYFEDGDYYQCKHCGRRYKKDQKTKSTGNLNKHYNEQHGFRECVEILPAKKRRLDSPLSTNEESNKEELKEATVRFFASFGIPFHAAESPEFIRMMQLGGMNFKPFSRPKLLNKLSQVAESDRTNLKGTVCNAVCSSRAKTIEDLVTVRTECFRRKFDFVGNEKPSSEDLDLMFIESEKIDELGVLFETV